MPDLTPEQLAEVRAILAAHIPDRDVYAFGSRAVGRARRHSDLDLAIDGPAPLDLGVRAWLREAFEESSLPFRVDIVELCEVEPGFRGIVDAQKMPITAETVA
jgi:type I restriction enzyme S subunit